MARIRTIKPEFPQSESMGRVSREARLLFVNLWTVSDDEGRTRGASRLLASLLYPYDNDAVDLIDCWLAELERENCIVRYEIEGTTYLQLINWLEHQKIDKPSKSRLPQFAEASRILANAREASATDLGPRTMDHGPRTSGVADATGDNIIKIDSAGYVFEGNIIRLKAPQLERWRKAYPNIPNITAALETADAYYSDRPPKDGKWFFAASSWLQRENDKYLANSKQAEKDLARLRGDAW